MNISQPLISIVIPTYNRADMLTGSIESCLNQSYENIELIIVNDGSTDSTEQIVHRFAENDNRVRYIKKPNDGLPNALNSGFNKAKGDYYTWTSDDNLYGKEAIEIMVNALQENENCKLVYCDYHHINEKGDHIGCGSRKGPEFITKEPTVGACFLYSAESAKSVGEYDPGWVLIEDAEFFLRFAKSFSCIHLKGVRPYYYRIHEESLAATRYEAIQRQRAKLYSLYSESIFESFRLYSKFHYDCSLWHYNSNNFLNSIKHILLSIILNPRSTSAWKLSMRILLPKQVKRLLLSFIKGN